MLIREDEDGVLAIGQQSHAWLSGQLARLWGNERFGRVEPYEEVCLAADQHDVGWGEPDQRPALDFHSGWPLSFTDFPLEAHLKIFTDGPRRLISQSRYAALLVSMHGWRLYERRDLDRASPADARAIRRFLGDQELLQAELRAALREDRNLAVADATIERNSMLIWTWDYLSLALCLGWSPATAKRCPVAEGVVELELSPGDGCLHLDPWPFADESVSVRCEGRRLKERFEDEAAMREALARARWETLAFELRPARR